MSSKETHDLSTVLGCSFALIAPTAIAAVIPKRWIIRWHKQLLASSIGTISAFLFIGLIPETIHMISCEIKKPEGISVTSVVMFFVALFAGISISTLLKWLDPHESKSNKNDEQRNSESIEKTEEVVGGSDVTDINQTATAEQDPESLTLSVDNVSSQQQRDKMNNKLCFTIPSTVKTIVFATMIHNMIDGMMIGIQPMIAIPLFAHELTHSLGHIVLFVNLGMRRRNALILRLFTDLFVPLSAYIVYLWGVATINKTMQICAHCLLIGLFLQILFVDLFPIVLGKDHGHSHDLGVDEECTNKDIAKEESDMIKTTNEMKKSKPLVPKINRQDWKEMMYSFVCYLIAFGVVTVIIAFTEHHH